VQYYTYYAVYIMQVGPHFMY